VSLEKHFHYDKWLSDVLQHEVYRLDVSDELIKFPESTHRAFSSIIRSKNVFVYGKVRVHNHGAIKLLENLGFNLVDTNIIFEKPIDSPSRGAGPSEIRFALPEDRQGVRSLAAYSFSCSRFHLDPLIPDDKADQVKASWAENFFFGKRGDSMVISSVDGKIAGFLQLLHSGKDLVIDLIAVDRKFRRKRIASDMIYFAQNALKGFKRVRVGTQLANMPSIRMYERLNFMLIDAFYVFHYHNS
jgi:ribosomal protein S18 acetylase RimI-like enzyme